MFKIIAQYLHQTRPQIRVSKADLISHKLHALGPVVLKGFSCTLQPVQGSKDDFHILFIRSKLRSKYSIHRFFACHFGLSVHDVSILDAHVVQILHHQSNTLGLTRYNTFYVIVGGTSVM